MTSAALALAVIEYHIAERTAQLVRLHLYLCTARLPFDDFVAASNAAAAFEHDLTRWEAVSAAIREK